MEPGMIVEYIDRQRIMCALVLEVKNQRLRLLTENNREVKLTTNRLLYLPGLLCGLISTKLWRRAASWIGNLSKEKW